MSHGLDTLIARHAVHELRFLGRGGTVAAGFFTDPVAASEAISEWDGRVRGLYITLNPAQPDLLDRSPNRLRRRPPQNWCTGDTHVLRRCWLPIDVDPIRHGADGPLVDQKVPTTDAEHALAAERTETIAAWLGARGWPVPARLDSGNGAWLAYRVDLPNDRVSRDLVHTVLCAVGHQFDDEAATVDKKMANAARIGRLPGTLNRKGQAAPHRPHRRAGELVVPHRLDVVPVERIEAVAALKPPAAPRPPRQPWTGPEIDSTDWLTRWLERSGLHHGPVTEWKGGWIVELDPCPWEPDHDEGHAYVGVMSGGEIFAGCHGNRCDGKGWRDLRDVIEPNRRDIRSVRRRPFLAALLGVNR